MASLASCFRPPAGTNQRQKTQTPNDDANLELILSNSASVYFTHGQQLVSLAGHKDCKQTARAIPALEFNKVKSYLFYSVFFGRRQFKPKFNFGLNTRAAGSRPHKQVGHVQSRKAQLVHV